MSDGIEIEVLENNPIEMEVGNQEPISLSLGEMAQVIYGKINGVKENGSLLPIDSEGNVDVSVPTDNDIHEMGYLKENDLPKYDGGYSDVNN